MPRASLAEVARAAFPRNQRDRVPHALVGGVGRLSEGVLEGRTLGECGLERVTAGNQRVDHRLVSGLGLAASLDACDRRFKRGGPVVRAELLLAGHGHSHLHKQRSVGGAGGPLYGTLFMQMGMAVSGKEELSPDDWAAALEAAVTGVQARGKAEPGDKTMIDALIPGRDALKAALAEGATFEDALRQSADAADQGMRDTVPLVARKGRASYLGERSAGHQDPGATSSHLLLEAAAETWGRPRQAR